MQTNAKEKKNLESCDTYFIWVDITQMDDNGNKDVVRLPYMGKSDVDVSTKFVDGFLYTPLNAKSTAIRFGQPTTIPFKIMGVQQLGIHMDYILEAIYNQSLSIKGMTITSKNEVIL